MLITRDVISRGREREFENLTAREAHARIRELWVDFENERFHEGGVVDESSYDPEVLDLLSPRARAYLRREQS